LAFSYLGGGRVGARDMPILRLLQEAAFDAATVQIMTSVFDDIVREMKLARTDPIATTIAKNIIKLAQTGERDAARLREQATAFLRN
jgi:hypothetical protein